MLLREPRVADLTGHFGRRHFTTEAQHVGIVNCARAINDSNVLCLGGKVTTPEMARQICDAWLAQEHGKPPSDPAPEWWSGDVEAFLAEKWPAIHKVEDESRKH